MNAGELAVVRCRVPVYRNNWDLNDMSEIVGYIASKQLVIVLEVSSSGSIKVISPHLIGYVDGDEVRKA